MTAIAFVVRAFTAMLRLAAGVSAQVSALGLLILMMLTFADVFCRSVFNAPIEMTTELSRLLLMVVVFASLPRITLGNQHVSVDLLAGILNRFGYARIEGAIMIGTGVLLTWPLMKIHVLAARAMRYGDRTEFLGFPVFVATWFVLIFTALTVLCFLAAGIALMAGRNADPEPAGGLT